MKSPLTNYLLAALLIVPLLSGCPLDDDDDDDPSPPSVSGDDGNGVDDSGGDGSGDGDADPNSFNSIFNQPADGDPMDPDDPEALLADTEATFGQPEDAPQEPDAVLDLADE